MTTVTASLAEALVDFNAVDENGLVHVPRTRVVGFDTQHGLILLRDTEGTSCLGVVDEVTQDGMRVAVVWETWQDAPIAPNVSAGPVPGVSVALRTSGE